MSNDNIASVIGTLPNTKECHCTHTADKYYKRTFINQLGHKVSRVFYRCRNCSSRIHEDFIPKIEGEKLINVMDLLNSNYR